MQGATGIIDFLVPSSCGCHTMSNDTGSSHPLLPASMRVYSGSLYIVCPHGADLEEFEARRREWLLYESVIDLEKTFQAALDAKNSALDGNQKASSSHSWWSSVFGMIGNRNSSHSISPEYQRGSPRTPRAAQTDEIVKQLMDEVESLRSKLKAKEQELSQCKSKLKIEATEKSKLIEANRVLSDQIHLRADFMQEKEDAHSKAMAEAVQVVQELQAALLMSNELSATQERAAEALTSGLFKSPDGEHLEGLQQLMLPLETLQELTRTNSGVLMSPIKDGQSATNTFSQHVDTWFAGWTPDVTSPEAAPVSEIHATDAKQPAGSKQSAEVEEEPDMVPLPPWNTHVQSASKLSSHIKGTKPPALKLQSAYFGTADVDLPSDASYFDPVNPLTQVPIVETADKSHMLQSSFTQGHAMENCFVNDIYDIDQEDISFSVGTSTTPSFSDSQGQLESTSTKSTSNCPEMKVKDVKHLSSRVESARLSAKEQRIAARKEQARQLAEQNKEYKERLNKVSRSQIAGTRRV